MPTGTHGVPFTSGEFMQMFTWVPLAFAVTVGFRQLAWESGRGTFLFLLVLGVSDPVRGTPHRPVARTDDAVLVLDEQGQLRESPGSSNHAAMGRGCTTTADPWRGGGAVAPRTWRPDHDCYYSNVCGNLGADARHVLAGAPDHPGTRRRTRRLVLAQAGPLPDARSGARCLDAVRDVSWSARMDRLPFRSVLAGPRIGPRMRRGCSEGPRGLCLLRGRFSWTGVQGNGSVCVIWLHAERRLGEPPLCVESKGAFPCRNESPEAIPSPGEIRGRSPTHRGPGRIASHPGRTANPQAAVVPRQTAWPRQADRDRAS